jgi:tetratricopeptide (TPR) repeat protein
MNAKATEGPVDVAPSADALNGAREGSTAKLRRRLSGDLDTIVLQAMRKDPRRRYASVEQFAEDIRRHLDGRPVAARRDSWKYRAGKFAVRHKLTVAATAIVIVAVLGGVAATVREARIAAANERRAEQRFNDVRKLANSLMFEIHDAIRDLPGSTPARRLLVTRALEYLDNLSQQSKGDASLQKELAAAYERVGDVLGYPYGANLGDRPGAEQSYRKSLAIRQTLVAADPNDAQVRRDLVSTYFRIAQVLESSGDFKGALEAVNKARSIQRPLPAGSNDPALADQSAGGYYFTATLESQIGDVTAALQNYQRAAAISEAALQTYPDNLLLRTHMAGDYSGIAQCMRSNHDLSHAIPMQSKAASILEEASKAHPENATITEYLGEALNRLAGYDRLNGEHSAALETYRRSNKMFGDLLRADPKNSLAKSNFGFSNSGIGWSLMALGKAASGAKTFRESIASFEEMSPRTASMRYPRSGLADAYSGLGESYSILAAAKGIASNQKREYWQESVTSCQKSLAIWNDKEKRGELESDEQDDPARAAHCVAVGEEHLRSLVAERNGPK